MPAAASEPAEIKMYSDYKSPYAFLAFDPAFALKDKYNVHVRWLPFQLRIKGKGQRSVYSEYKVRYSYVDARRHANLLDEPLMLRGPLKIYNTEPALIGGLFAQQQNRLLDYSRHVFTEFFKRELEIDEADAIAGVIKLLGMDEAAYRDYLAGQGKVDYEAALEEGSKDHIFGVPMFMFNGEQFWGYDRMDFLERRLSEAGLAK